MSCDQLNDTLAWLYGEGDETHASHIASCEACLQIVADHEQVLSAVTRARPVSAATPDTDLRRGLGARWGWVAGIAAAVMVAVLVPGESQRVSSEPSLGAAVAADLEPMAWDVELDQDLEELAWDVQLLSDDGSIL